MSGKGNGRFTKLGVEDEHYSDYNADKHHRPSTGYLKQIKDKLSELEERIDHLEKAKR